MPPGISDTTVESRILVVPSFTPLRLHSQLHNDCLKIHLDLSAMRAALAAVVGLSNMLGLIANDLVFDLSAPATASAYYCTLLPTFIDWRIVRMSGVLLAGMGVGCGLVIYRRLGDLVTTLLLSVGGIYAFYNTLSLAMTLCSSPDTVPANAEELMASMAKWHVFMFTIITLSLFLQLRSMFENSDHCRQLSKSE